MTTTEHDKARMRAYYRANREKILAYNRAWIAARPGYYKLHKNKTT